jgi:hypothetical protein
MPRRNKNNTILAEMANRIAEGRRIIEVQKARLKRLNAEGLPTDEAEGILHVYVSSLEHLVSHEQKMKQENDAKRGESRKLKFIRRRVNSEHAAKPARV